MPTLAQHIGSICVSGINRKSIRKMSPSVIKVRTLLNKFKFGRNGSRPEDSMHILPSMDQYFLAPILFLFLLFIVTDFLAPLPTDRKGSFAQIVTDRKGIPLRAYPDSNGVWRYPVTIDQVSENYVDILLTYEDRWFYHHPGVNPLALTRAAWQWLFYGEVVSGGSTLTMQVARILDPHSRSIPGKLKQMFRALQLEWHYSKNEILELYLNYAPFGGTIEGVQTASYVYLGKSASQLSDAEAALLAVLPQSPSRIRPDRYTERARLARNKVLNRMNSLGDWNQSRVNDAKFEPIFAQYKTMPKIAPLLSRRLAKQFPESQLITTTIDHDLQLTLKNSVHEYIDRFPAKTSAALLLIDNRTMNVLAYVGSADFENDERFGHVDMIKANRSPGSTLKPFLYGLAMDDGLIHEQSLLIDAPMDFGGYHPENFNRKYKGPVSARQALRQSLNVPAVQLLHAFGSERFYAQLRSAGLRLTIPGRKPNLAMILGGAGASLENLVQTYSSIGRKGLVQTVNYVMQNGSSREANSLEKTLLSEEAAWLVFDALNNTNMTQRNFASADRQLAVKTGTSYGYRDAWALGTNQNITLGVWIGRPDGTPLIDNVGRRSAVPLLERAVALLPNALLKPPSYPEGLEITPICWPLGQHQNRQPDSWCFQIKNARLIDGTAPTTLPGYFSTDSNSITRESLITTVMLNKEGLRVSRNCLSNNLQVYDSVKEVLLWPIALEPFLPLKWRRSERLPTYHSDCSALDKDKPILVTGLKDGSTVYINSGNDKSIQLNVKAIGGNGKIHWYLNRDWLKSTTATTSTVNRVFSHQIDLPELLPGQQTLSLMDQSGQLQEIKFTVSH